MSDLYVQYGCGLSAPPGWLNFDASPTLRLQRLPVFGKVFLKASKTKFPAGVRFGDILQGLPLADGSCAGLYCSHVLEHLSYEDFNQALKNSFRLLKPGGIFRLVMPDLEHMAQIYLQAKDSGDPTASVDFMRSTLLGYESRARGLRSLTSFMWGNSRHLWLWDSASTREILSHVGFRSMRECSFNDSDDKHFTEVEDKDRFKSACAIEAHKEM